MAGRNGLPQWIRASFTTRFVTAAGERRAQVALKALETLWFNTGTLCNLTCGHCYIESSPKNDRLVYLTAAEVAEYLDEIAEQGLPTRLIGFTGGEPFMNPELPAMLDDALSRGFDALVLTNAMKPMAKCKPALLRLNDRYGDRLTIRVSIDHYGRRGSRGGARPAQLEADDRRACAGSRATDLRCTSRAAGCRASRKPKSAPALPGCSTSSASPSTPPIRSRLMVFPEMDAAADVPEITEACWGILGKSPESVMCATARMVVKRKGAARPAVLACTLLPYDERFELGATLAAASGAVPLNHPHCAKFCVLGGGACSRS